MKFLINSNESLSEQNDSSADPLIQHRPDGSVHVTIRNNQSENDLMVAPPGGRKPHADLSLHLKCYSEDGLGRDKYSPTYPTYSNQMEYGNHNYHYHHGHGYHHSHSPYGSPLGHSESDTFLAKVSTDDGVRIHRSKETETIPELADESSPYDDKQTDFHSSDASTVLIDAPKSKPNDIVLHVPTSC